MWILWTQVSPGLRSETLARILHNHHLVRLQRNRMGVAPALNLVGPGLAHPRLAVLVDLLDGEYFADHRLNVVPFICRQIIEPLAGKGKDPDRCADFHRATVDVQGRHGCQSLVTKTCTVATGVLQRRTSQHLTLQTGRLLDWALPWAEWPGFHTEGS